MSTKIGNLIGNTPMIEIEGIKVKLEMFNPSGSIKDRMAFYLMTQAEKRGELRPGMEVIEVTSGNAGISFAMLCAIKKYKFTAIMPESMSIERRQILKAYGANLVLTPAEEDMSGAVSVYNSIIKERQNAWLPKQFSNPDNPTAYEKGLALEILSDTDEKFDAFVAGIGTGGTIIGVARAVKQRHKKVRIIGVEPTESAVISGHSPSPHKIQGIGEGFIPDIVNNNLNLIDEIITVSSEEAIKTQIELAREYGLLVGVSSGANFVAARKLKNKFARIVTVFPDGGVKYLRNYTLSKSL